MTKRLVRVWAWVGGHRLLAGWLAAMLGLLTLGSGVALGATRDAAPIVETLPDGAANGQPPKVVAPKSAAVEAVIVGRRPQAILARTKQGDFIRIRTNENTVYKRGAKAMERDELRRGMRIVVLGRPNQAEGVMTARSVTVRGMIKMAPPPAEALDLPR